MRKGTNLAGGQYRSDRRNCLPYTYPDSYAKSIMRMSNSKPESNQVILLRKENCSILNGPEKAIKLTIESTDK